MCVALLFQQAIPQIEAGLKAKQEGRLDDAIAAYRKALEAEPNLWALQASLGEVYYRKRDYANAIPTLRRALELKDDQPGVHGMLGVSLLSQGQAAQAITHLERGQVWDALGAALLESGRTREALARLELARSKHPDDPDVLFHLGQAYGRLSREAFDQIAARHPDSLRARQIRAEALAAAGRMDAAEQEYREVLRLRPDLPGIHLALGEMFLAASAWEKAAAEFRAEGGSPVAAARLGGVLLKLGRTEEALAELSRADRLRPDAPETLYDLGKARAASNDDAGAEKAWLRVVALGGPLAGQAHHQLFLLYRRLGRAADAERHRPRP
ncbi:MAG: tetratricopeptide repeat protein [Candidatus Solibacter usitatus]|nr:tetratricopeptide repeat protein [Candidatus Solibacter usitatus]